MSVVYCLAATIGAVAFGFFVVLHTPVLRSIQLVSCSYCGVASPRDIACALLKFPGKTC